MRLGKHTNTGRFLKSIVFTGRSPSKVHVNSLGHCILLQYDPHDKTQKSYDSIKIMIIYPCNVIDNILLEYLSSYSLYPEDNVLSFVCLSSLGSASDRIYMFLS